jgi:hypothetical protein
LLKALPLKLYRREIASVGVKCNPRTSLLYQNDNPAQNIITTYPSSNGLVTTLDFNYEINTCQHPKNKSSATTTCIAQQSYQNNALRRVRSAGMIKRKFNQGSNNDTYYTDTNQYLTSRNRTFQQNQYFHIRQGNSSAIPGTLAAAANVYSSNGINHCPKFNVTNATQFVYKWIDGFNYTVNVPTGSYDINDFNNLFQSTMFQNTHYFLSSVTNTPVFLLTFVYNTAKNRIEFDSLTTTIYNTTGGYYRKPTIATWTYTTGLTPQVILPVAPVFQQGLGFNSGNYPISSANVTNQSILGQATGLLGPNYVPIYYKPNNPQFGRQGAVTAGDRITRLKYDTINTAGSTFRNAFGNQTADALAYGVPSYGYTLKDRVGFNLINVPVINKYTGSLSKCKTVRTIRNMRNG